MVSIFYDLETTHLTPMGQILNCCFIAVDRSWNEIARCAHDIKISPLQLPDPDAMLANRTATLTHQQAATKTERQALREIHTFVHDMIGYAKGPVELIGYNSGRFDLNFLRTSLIRNGLNPYFYGKVVPRDLLHTVRHLSATDPSFPRACKAGSADNRKATLSLSLETISRELGLLSGKQSHHAVADVELTIQLAKSLERTFHVDGRLYAGYAANQLHELGREHSVLVALAPQADLRKQEIATRVPFTLLCNDQKNGLWVDLAQYREGKGRQAIRWMGANSGSLCAEPDDVMSHEYAVDAKQARDEFRDISISNFFSRSTCDVEADIFRISFSEIDNLTSAIWGGDRRAVLTNGTSDAKELYVRHLLSELDWDAVTETQEKRLATYATYRYGGACNIDKSHLEPIEPSIANPAAHSTLNQYIARIETLRSCTSSEQDLLILNELMSFYEQSPIMRVAGRKLMEHVRVPALPTGAIVSEIVPPLKRANHLSP